MDVPTSQVVSVPLFKNIFFLVLTFSAGSFVFLLIVLINIDPKLYINYNVEIYPEMQYRNNRLGNLINTKGCRIPLVEVDEKLIKKIERNITSLRPCRPNPLLNSNRSHIWIEKRNMPSYNLNDSDLTCCYRSFYRPKWVDDITSLYVDDRVEYNSCRNFSDIIQVEDEFVRVTCRATEEVFDSFYAFPLKKVLVKNLKKDLPYNILVLGTDSVSRLNLHRTMPETVKYLKELGAVELLGYNKVADNTFPNLMPLLLGKNATESVYMCMQNSEATFDNCPFIWKRAQRTGFATALGEDTSLRGTFNFARRGFIDTPTDYYLHTFIHEAEQKGTNIDGRSRLCINERYFFKVLLDYVADLTFLDRKLFGFFWEIGMSHDNLNYAKAMDGDYREFFTNLHKSGYLNKTIIFFMSDHGMRYGNFRATKQGFLEDRLPFVFALMPPSFRNNFTLAYDNLKTNSHRLATPFDMHATISDLLNLEYIENDRLSLRAKESYTINRGISLFLPIPVNRTCKTAAIDDHWCTCHQSKTIDRSNYVAKSAVEHAVSHLNKLLKEYHQCDRLFLDELMEATQIDAGEEKDWVELTVVFRTTPGGGVFEATLRNEGGFWALAGSVSRVNLYGNQSYCIPIPELKLYCYCI